MQEKNVRLEAQKKALEENIDAYNKAKNKASNTINKVMERIKYVKEPCDCYNARIDDSIIDLVRGISN